MVSKNMTNAQVFHCEAWSAAPDDIPLQQNDEHRNNSGCTILTTLTPPVVTTTLRFDAI